MQKSTWVGIRRRLPSLARRASICQRPHGSAEGRDGERQRIELLIIPQLGEVKTNRGRLPVLAGLHPIEEPVQAFLGGRDLGTGDWGLGAVAGGEEGLDGEGGFFDGGF